MTEMNATELPPVAPPNPAVPKKPGKGMRILLAVSLGLNLAVAGFVIGDIAQGGLHGGRDQMVRDLGFGPYSEALSPEERRDLRKNLFERAPEIRDARKQARQDIAGFLEVLRATPFDPAALEGAMGAQQARLSRQLALGQEALRDLLVKMTDAQRLDFANRLERGLRRGPDGDDDHGRRKD